MRRPKTLAAAGIAIALVAAIALPQAANADGQVGGVDYAGLENDSGQVGFWNVQDIKAAVPLDSDTPADSGYTKVLSLKGTLGYGSAEWALINLAALNDSKGLYVPTGNLKDWQYESGIAGVGSSPTWNYTMMKKQRGVMAGIVSDQWSDPGKSSLDTFDWSASAVDEKSYDAMAKAFNAVVGDNGGLKFAFDKSSYNWTKNYFSNTPIPNQKINDDRPRLTVNGVPAPYTPVKYRLTSNTGLDLNSPLRSSNDGWITVRTDANGYLPLDIFTGTSGSSRIAGEILLPQSACEIEEFSHGNGTRVVGTQCPEAEPTVITFRANVTLIPTVSIDTPPIDPWLECGVVNTYDSSYWEWNSKVVTKDGEPAMELEAKWLGSQNEVYEGPEVQKVYYKLSDLEADKAKCAPVLVEAVDCGVEATIDTPDRPGITYSRNRVGNTVTVTASYINGSNAEGQVLAPIAGTNSYKIEAPKPSYWSWDVEIPKIIDCEQPKIEVTPVAPRLSPSDQCGVEGTVYIPQVEGVSYNQTRVGQAVKVTASPLDGYTFAAGATTEWIIDIPKAEDCEPNLTVAVPVKPKLKLSGECGVESKVVTEKTDGIVYSQTRSGNKVTVTAAAQDGYVIAAGEATKWVFEIPAVEKCDPKGPSGDKNPGDPKGPDANAKKGDSLTKTGAADNVPYFVAVGGLLIAGSAAIFFGRRKMTG